MPRLERHPRVSPGLDIGQRLEARRGGDQHRGGLGEACAHHRHVARVIDDAVLLLERGLVLLIDHHEAEIGERQEQRRAGADHHGGLARRSRRDNGPRRRLDNGIDPGLDLG